MRKITVRKSVTVAILLGIFIAIGLALSSFDYVQAQTPATNADGQTYAPRGADTCLTCHNNPAVTAITESSHWQRANPRSPLANQACESCHGAAPAHYQSMQPPGVVFGAGDGRFPASAVAVQNQMCLNCHQTDETTHWASSEHEFAEVSCATCHKVHQAGSSVPTAMASIEQCLDCHLDLRAQINQRSHHPLTEGLMTCTSCHNPHGSDTVALLAKATLNDTCTTCHAEKRGPFLWEHEPVTDDCTNCHNPHGATQDRLLATRQPFLCQACHSEAFHPSSLYSGRDIPPSGAGQSALGASCTNCHSQVHGSNHPSGSRLTR